MSITYPPGPISLMGQRAALQQIDAQVTYIGHEGTKFYLAGPLAPVAGAQDGVVLPEGPRGLMPPIMHLSNQGARQDGVTWQDALFGAGEIDMTLETSTYDASRHRSVVRAWLGAWSTKKTGVLSWWTPEMGEWWCNVRQYKTVPDIIADPRRTRQKFTWTAQNDNALWQSVDSVSTFQGNGTGFLPLTNIGSEDAWPRYLCYGPGTFTIGDGPSATSAVTFGPLLAGQIALITTLPRLRSVVDLSPNLPPQALSQWQAFLKGLISFATNNNVPPLLQQFESWFGILPPQGVMYSLMNGRFTTPIPPKLEGVAPTEAHIPISITGGNSGSKVVAAVTPLRSWPE